MDGNSIDNRTLEGRMSEDYDPHEGRGAMVFMVIAWIIATIAIIVAIAEVGRPSTLP